MPTRPSKRLKVVTGPTNFCYWGVLSMQIFVVLMGIGILSLLSVLPKGCPINCLFPMTFEVSRDNTFLTIVMGNFLKIIMDVSRTL